MSPRLSNFKKQLDEKMLEKKVEGMEPKQKSSFLKRYANSLLTTYEILGNINDRVESPYGTLSPESSFVYFNIFIN